MLLDLMRIKDPPAELWLSLYVDSDFGSSPDMKSTSGFILALQGPDSFAVILWGSKTQRAVSRSTTEAEFVTLSTALFGDAISLLAGCQKMIASTFVLKYMRITKQCRLALNSSIWPSSIASMLRAPVKPFR